MLTLPSVRHKKKTLVAMAANNPDKHVTDPTSIPVVPTSCRIRGIIIQHHVAMVAATCI